MTVVAYDGETIAADRQITVGDVIQGYTKKILRWSGGYWTSAGRITDGDKFKEWLEDPSKTFRPKKDFGAFFTKDGVVYEVDRELSPYVAMPRTGLGDGADMAVTLMNNGDSATEAVRKVCKLNIYCGGRVDTVTII